MERKNKKTPNVFYFPKNPSFLEDYDLIKLKTCGELIYPDNTKKSIECI